MARKGNRRSRRPRRNVSTAMPLPVQRMRVPKDPPSYVQIPPWRRRIQLEYQAPRSGTTISPLVSDFFSASFATDHHKTCIIKSVRVWSSASNTKGTSLVCSVGSPVGSTVPVITLDDKAPVNECARVGFRLKGPYVTPWSKSASFCSVASDSYPVLIEFTALFL